MTIISQPVHSGQEKALTTGHNSFDEQSKSVKRAGDDPVAPSDFEAGCPLLDPREIDPNAGELPPSLRDGLQAALHARLRGFKVIQLLPDGTPANPDWRNDATADKAVIRERWTRAPGCKVGGVTDSLVVLALTGSEGVDQYAAPAATTNTAAVLSRAPERILLFFRVPTGVRSIEGALLPGVDILSSNGYVELPSGSAIDGWGWVNRYPVAPAPQWLLDQLAALAASHTSQGNDDMGAGAEAIEAFKKGQLDGTEAPPIAANPDPDIEGTDTLEDDLSEDMDEAKDEKDTSGIATKDRAPSTSRQPRRYKSKLEAALDHARRDFRVFPLLPNSKTPPAFMTEWQYAATDVDTKRIHRWWQENPDYNIGIVMESRRAALDADVRKGGLETLKALAEAENLSDHETLIARTATGGLHLIYRLPEQHAQKR
jgi:hypothetical protein